MKNFTVMRTGFILLVTVLFSGCGVNQIKPDVKKQIRTTEVQIIIKQAEIYGSVMRKQGGLGSFGAIAALASKETRMKRNAKAIKPVVKALKGYKVRGLAKRVYNSGLKNVTWMKSSKVKIVKQDISQDDRYKITKNSKADAVMFIELDYHIDDSFKAFEVETRTTMFRQTKPDPAAKPDVVYHTFHTYRWNLPNNADGIYEHNELGKKWSENKAAILRQKIKQGLEVEVQHIVKEMEKS